MFWSITENPPIQTHFELKTVSFKRRIPHRLKQTWKGQTSINKTNTSAHAPPSLLILWLKLLPLNSRLTQIIYIHFKQTVPQISADNNTVPSLCMELLSHVSLLVGLPLGLREALTFHWTADNKTWKAAHRWYQAGELPCWDAHVWETLCFWWLGSPEREARDLAGKLTVHTKKVTCWGGHPGGAAGTPGNSYWGEARKTWFWVTFLV